jgi:hypothetical protein
MIYVLPSEYAYKQVQGSSLSASQTFDQTRPDQTSIARQYQTADLFNSGKGGRKANQPNQGGTVVSVRLSVVVQSKVSLQRRNDI